MNDTDSMVGGCIVPHPPLLIPAIGGPELSKVEATREAMQKLGEKLEAVDPESLVMISPHTPPFRDAFIIKDSGALQGGFASFGCPQVRIAKENDLELVEAMSEAAAESGLPLLKTAATPSGRISHGDQLDHGLLVPLYYLDQHFETPIVCLSISGLDYAAHFRLGEVARQACERVGRRAIFVASGDLSHGLIPSAPAGYSPRGKEFDEKIVEIAGSGDFDAMYRMDEGLVEEAMECGFRSIHALWGAIKDGALTSEVLSYEGPFGVGYLVSLHLRKARGEE